MSESSYCRYCCFIVDIAIAAIVIAIILFVHLFNFAEVSLELALCFGLRTALYHTPPPLELLHLLAVELARWGLLPLPSPQSALQQARARRRLELCPCSFLCALALVWPSPFPPGRPSSRCCASTPTQSREPAPPSSVWLLRSRRAAVWTSRPSPSPAPSPCSPSSDFSGDIANLEPIAPTSSTIAPPTLPIANGTDQWPVGTNLRWAQINAPPISA